MPSPDRGSPVLRGYRPFSKAFAPDFRRGLGYRSYFVFLMLALTLGRPLLFADAKVELELQPATVSLPPGVMQPASAVVVVHNRTDETLRDLRLLWLPRPGLDIQSASSLSLPALGPHADHVWPLAIQPARRQPSSGAAGPSAMAGNAGLLPGATALAGPIGPPEIGMDETLDLRLEYKSTAGSPQVVLTSLPVRTTDLGDLDKTLDVQIRAALTSLSGSQSGSIYLVLNNKSSRTINIVNLVPIGAGITFCQDRRTKQPDRSLPFCFNAPFHPVIVPPYQSVIHEFPVRAYSRFRAGNYLLMFQLATQPNQGGAPFRSSIVVTQAVDVGAGGNPAVLKLAAIPLFLLLPGVLTLITMDLLWRLKWLGPLDESDLVPLWMNYRRPYFWLFAVAISLVFCIAYWALTKTWYFDGYGLPEIAWLWFASILGGVGGYVIWWFYRYTRWLHAEEKERMLAEAAQLKSRK